MYLFFTILFVIEMLGNLHIAPYETDFCIVQFDPMLTRLELTLDNVRDETEFLKRYHGLESIRTNASLSLLLNKAYAIRHNYPYFASNGHEYEPFLAQYSHYNSSWIKLKFIHDIQVNNPGCKWIAYLSTNSYFWMDGHEENLAHWMNSIEIMDTSKSYRKLQELRLNFRPLENEMDALGVVLLVGLEGVYHRLGPGKYYPALSRFLDYASDSVFLVRNNHVGKNLIWDWLYQPDHTEYVGNLYNHYGNHGKREQTILNRLIIPHYEDRTAFLSFKDTQFKQGNIIRRGTGEDMNSVIQELSLGNERL